MEDADLQGLCERGQRQLMETRYLEAANTLAKAEQQAWDLRAFDTLSRLYLPLQEARRQIRQRCGEGAVKMHVLATRPELSIAADEILTHYAHGQFLIAGWGTIRPGIDIRASAHQQNLYVETFLAAVYPVLDSEPVVIIVADETATLPDPISVSAEELRLKFSPDHLMLQQSEIPADASAGTAETFAGVMALWERLHQPFLEAAMKISDPMLRMQAYRQTLKVDPACELAHQFLADIARDLARRR